MDTNYTPKVGDRVRHDAWGKGDTARVTAVGERKVLMVRGLLPEASWDICQRWHKVETPLPEQWFNVYPGNIGWPAYSHGITAEESAGDHRIAVLHIWTDADGVDHAEIERVTA